MRLLRVIAGSCEVPIECARSNCLPTACFAALGHTRRVLMAAEWSSSAKHTTRMTVARTQPSGRIGDSASDGYGSCKIILSSGFLCSRPISDTHGDLCDVPGARRDEEDIM